MKSLRKVGRERYLTITSKILLELSIGEEARIEIRELK
jgi:hypothetical protein